MEVAVGVVVVVARAVRVHAVVPGLVRAGVDGGVVVVAVVASRRLGVVTVAVYVVGVPVASLVDAVVGRVVGAWVDRAVLVVAVVAGVVAERLSHVRAVSVARRQGQVGPVAVVVPVLVAGLGAVAVLVQAITQLGRRR